MERLEELSEKLALSEELFCRFRKECGRDGIGRLAEKSVHGILKFYFDPDSAHHEVPLAQGPVADIFDGMCVTEIQTGSYTALTKKLPRILPHYPVHVVCPLIRDSYLYTVDPSDGRIEGGRKSPRHAGRPTALVALAALDPFLDDPRFTLTFLLIDTAEYRSVPSAGKRRGKKLDQIPTTICDVWTVKAREEYNELLPAGLPDVFTAKDFSRKAHLRGRKAFSALKLLRDSGTVLQVGKEGRAYLYQTTVAKQSGGAI